MAEGENALFRLAVYGQKRGVIEEKSQIIFVDRDNIMTKPNSVLADLIFTFAARKSLLQMEAYLYEKGFVSFAEQDIPENLGQSEIKVLKLDKYYGVNTTRRYSHDQAMQMIDEALGGQKSKGLS